MVKFKELKDLQDVDSRIDSLESKKAGLPQAEEIEMLRAEQSQLELKLAELQNQLRDEEHKQKKMEGELDLISLKIEKEESKLYSGTIANPKELSSIQGEIKSLKKQKDEHETELLEELDVVDGAKENLEEIKAHLASNSEKLSALEAEFNKLFAEIEEEVAELRKNRENILPAIPPDVLELYERLREDKQGVAVAELKDGVCRGCRMELPAEEVDKILHSDELWQCDNCKRILIR